MAGDVAAVRAGAELGGAAADGSEKAAKEAAGGAARAARSSLFRLGLDMFNLCLELGRDISCSLLFRADLRKPAKSVVY